MKLAELRALYADEKPEEDCVAVVLGPKIIEPKLEEIERLTSKHTTYSWPSGLFGWELASLPLLANRWNEGAEKAWREELLAEFDNGATKLEFSLGRSVGRELTRAPGSLFMGSWTG